MKIKEVVGIDVSKLTLDCCVHTSGVEKKFDNNLESIVAMVQWAMDNSVHDVKELLFVFEHTGLYTHRLLQHLASKGHMFRIVPALEIKRSLGIARGKDDRADARRIALYGYRTREEATPSKVPNETLESLKRLMSMRRKLVAQCAGHKATLGEQMRVLDAQQGELLFDVQREIIRALELQIAVLEQELDRLLESDPEIRRLFCLLTSIKGIGPVTARFLIVYTCCFTSFDTWRKFACYCGVAPFPNRSGTSLRGKTKVSHLANKEGKTLLSLCASSAINSNPEMKMYFNKRVSEGKNKQSTLNIIRNKLLARAFAVVKRGTPYVNTMKFAA